MFFNGEIVEVGDLSGESFFRVAFFSISYNNIYPLNNIDKYKHMTTQVEDANSPINKREGLQRDSADADILNSHVLGGHSL